MCAKMSCYIYFPIYICFLQNLTYLPGDDYMEFMKFKFNKDSMDRTVKLGWIVK